VGWGVRDESAEGEKVTGDWRNFHNAELTEIYTRHQLEKHDTGGACVTYGGDKR